MVSNGKCVIRRCGRAGNAGISGTAVDANQVVAQ